MSSTRRPQKNRAVYYVTNDTPPTVQPALIDRVNEGGTVDLLVFHEGDPEPQTVRAVTYGRGPNSWFWPGRENGA